jgi:hypothetical protein
MLVIGIVILLHRARTYVDISLKTLFLAPGLGIVLSLLLARAAAVLPGVLGSDWRTGAVKAAVFTIIYGATLLALERHQLLEMASFVTKRVFAKGG